MKIAIGMFYHEANSFNPYLIQKEDFTFAEGDEVLKRMYATEIFEQENAEIVPLIYAVAMPNGVASRDAFEFYANKITDIIEQNKDLDGIFLHLHGSMEVDGLGSGELELVKRIRSILGEKVKIGVGLDAHANTSTEFCKYINAVRNYRTVPHCDQKEMEQTVSRHIIKCIKEDMKTTPFFVRLPYAIHPEKALGATWPLNEIFAKLNELEKKPEIAFATLGIGAIWIDSPTLASNVAVTPSKDEYSAFAKQTAIELAEFVMGFKDSFEFEQLPLLPKDARRYSLELDVKPVFVSDSGDNTTGGGVGDHTVLLREYLLHCKDYRNKKVLIAGIYDAKAVSECLDFNEGDDITVNVGKNTTEDNKQITLKGKLKKKGMLRGYLGCENVNVGQAVTIEVGAVDVTLIDRPGSFISLEHFDVANLNVSEYDVIVVKQGYLFVPLRAVSKFSILALTPGATHQIIESLKYYKIVPPVYPLSLST